MYELFMTRDAHRFYEEADPVLARKLNRCFDTSLDVHMWTSVDPYRHPEVRRLKAPLAGYLRCRVGDWRVVYEVQEQEEMVITTLRSQEARLVTTDVVLLEIADALSDPVLRPHTLRFIDGIRQLPVLPILSASKDLLADGWRLYRQRLDSDRGLTSQA